MGGGVIGVARGNIQQMSFWAHAALSGECNYSLSVLTKLILTGKAVQILLTTYARDETST